MDIENFANNELKQQLEILIRELQNRKILYCLKCGKTDFFNSNCNLCKKTLRKIKEMEYI